MKTNKNDILRTGMNTYNFNSIFRFEPTSGYLYTIFPTSINGVYFPPKSLILKGPTFGGIDLYKYIGRPVVGSFMENSLAPKIFPDTLIIIGFA